MILPVIWFMNDIAGWLSEVPEGVIFKNRPRSYNPTGIEFVSDSQSQRQTCRLGLPTVLKV